MMEFINYTKNEYAYEFISADGSKLILPFDAVIFVEEEDGTTVIKLTASRKTVGILKNKGNA